MAISHPDNLFTLYFEKEVSSFKDAFNVLLRIVGAIDRLRNSLLGKSPRYFAEDSEDLREHLIKGCQSANGLCSSEDSALLEKLEKGDTEEDLKKMIRLLMKVPALLEKLEKGDTEEDLKKLRNQFMKVHEEIRKVRNPEGLEKLRKYLIELAAASTADVLKRPTVSAENDTIFYFQSASGHAWIAIEQTPKGRYKVVGDSNFLAYPSAVVATLSSKEYAVSTKVVLAQDVDTFEGYLFRLNFRRTGALNGEMVYEPNSEAKFEWFKLLRQSNGQYIVEAKQSDEPKTARRERRSCDSSRKLGRPVYIG